MYLHCCATNLELFQLAKQTLYPLNNSLPITPAPGNHHSFDFVCMKYGCLGWVSCPLCNLLKTCKHGAKRQNSPKRYKKWVSSFLTSSAPVTLWYFSKDILCIYKHFVYHIKHTHIHATFNSHKLSSGPCCFCLICLGTPLFSTCRFFSFLLVA